MMAGKNSHACTIHFKLMVVDYAKINGNRPAERKFGPPPIVKMIKAWHQQEDRLRTAQKKKHNLHRKPARWPALEDEIKN
uniref:Uncharacterized protein n=1 Tax=Octopus bimaculoides TaxID=37653 RepID=A0A0L8G161_OCTBM